MFVFEFNGMIFCNMTVYEGTDQGAETCRTTCELDVNRTDTGAKCTRIQDGGMSSYFIFAGLMAMDAAHHLVATFGKHSPSLSLLLLILLLHTHAHMSVQQDAPVMQPI
jgi:hypothetical protein